MANYVSGLLHKKVLDPITGQPTGNTVPLLPRTIAKNVIFNDGQDLEAKMAGGGGGGAGYVVYPTYAEYKTDYDLGLLDDKLAVITG